MARVSKRFAASVRSASSPAQISANICRSASCGGEGALQDSPISYVSTASVPAESRPARARSRQKYVSREAPLATTPMGTPMGSRSPPAKYMPVNSTNLDRVMSNSKEPTPCLVPELPGDDFCEGGVELSPTTEWRDGGSSDEGNSPLSTRSLACMPCKALERFWPRREDGQSNALFLDYDGTLREFEARPELAVPSAELMQLLLRIDARTDLCPHIISGRNQEFLQEHFGSLSRFTLIAEHGFQISTAPASVPDQADCPERQKSTPECRPLPEHHGRRWELWEHYGGNVRLFKDHENWKAIMRDEILQLVNETPGSHLEEKRSSLVWHYREVADEELGEASAIRAVEKLERLRDKEKIQDVKIAHGHKVVEVSYRNVRKGLVMRRLCEEKALFGQPFGGVLVAGDDVSDETMFEAAPDDFLTIKVGPGATLARFQVESPHELREFLWRIIA